MARESWTDKRLDDLKERIDERFDEVIRQMDERFDRVDERFKQVDAEMKHRFDRVEGDIRELRVAVTGMQRVMTQSVIAICALMVTGFLTLLGTTAF